MLYVEAERDMRLLDIAILAGPREYKALKISQLATENSVMLVSTSLESICEAAIKLWAL